jgi:hypothetical protein
MPDAVVPRPYEYDKRLWNTFSTQKAIVETSLDTIAVLASGAFSAKWDDYSLSCRLQSQPMGIALSVVKDESGKYYQSGFTTYLSPRNGSDWSFDVQFLFYGPSLNSPGPFAFQMPISSGGYTACFQWLPADELQQRQTGNWTIAPRDEPLPVIADGRGDGTERKYLVDKGGIYENDSNGSKAVLNRIFALNGLDLPVFLTSGHCRNDGKTRLYDADQVNISEIDYSAGAWQKTVIASMPAPAVTPGPPGKPGPPSPSMFDCLACADPRGEGRQSVYFGSGVCLYEARWSGAQWEQKVVDSVPFYAVYGSTEYPRVVNAACGDIRGDGKPGPVQVQIGGEARSAPLVSAGRMLDVPGNGIRSDMTAGETGQPVPVTEAGLYAPPFYIFESWFIKFQRFPR